MNRRVFLAGVAGSLVTTASSSEALNLLPRKHGSALGTWRTITSVPTPREGVAVGTLHERLYVLGGISPLGNTLNEVYDPELDIWLERAPLPRSLDHAGAVGWF